MSFRIFHTEFKQKLTHGDLVSSSKLCAPSAVCLYQKWPVLVKRYVTQEAHLRRAKDSGGLGVPQVLSYADGLSLHPDWPLDPCPTLYSELKKEAGGWCIVVQLECVPICLPGLEPVLRVSQGLCFQAIHCQFPAGVHPPHSWF